ncbi:hypothetical protein DPSP01_006880 [Paraphaeosphaeria sporulosa]|uniref:BTB domain-containing protein n=1 Tax=Paraphaeosphaeria sporulosa TaxID=1460663 RepID=A0A177CNC9_9PLEO|nr:uncharacterized protein CC84DRAFT_1257334 [Paraphaeosphaeria sporulosa]OAG08482.1 hypothetical protein CC84DRAFT_1257334 [Paraphaeosphaeria sporulosa]
MAGSFSDLILSDLFTFYVGTGEKKEVVRVHSRAIAATCDYMKNLIEGDMKEAHDRTAKQDVELEEFLRFVEYAYRGDFTAPSYILEERSAQAEVLVADVAQSPPAEVIPPAPTPPIWGQAVVEAADDAPVAADGGWGDWGVSTKKKKKEKKVKSKVDLFRTEEFNKRYYLLDAGPQMGFAPASNSAPEENFTPVFLAYARLYCFAEMRLIHGLKASTLHKLHFALSSFTLYPERIGDVVELARYTYENTPNRRADGTVDELRNLVVDYVACESAEIGKSNAFKELLEEGGEFVSDLWNVVSKHVI